MQHYKTYAWIAPADTVLKALRKDKLYGGFIVHTVELFKKGMAVNTSEPDAFFMFETQLEDVIKTAVKSILIRLPIKNKRK